MAEDKKSRLVTVTDWPELCRLIRDARDNGNELMLKPTRWYGERKTDRKTKQLKSEVGDNVLSITFEVTERKKEETTPVEQT